MMAKKSKATYVICPECKAKQTMTPFRAVIELRADGTLCYFDYDDYVSDSEHQWSGLMSQSQIARRFGATLRTWHRWKRQGKLPVEIRKMGAQWQFRLTKSLPTCKQKQ